MFVEDLKDGEPFPALPETLKELYVIDCPSLKAIPELPKGLTKVTIKRSLTLN